jgi:HK97 family phage prohead protease
MHDSTRPPLGQASKVRIEDGKLKARVHFDAAEIDPFAEQIFQKIKSGSLRATSVGFIPTKYNFVDDPERRFGIDFLEQELLEFSIVTVPANPEALIGKSYGLLSVEEVRRLESLPMKATCGNSLDLSRRKLALAKLRAA